MATRQPATVNPSVDSPPDPSQGEVTTLDGLFAGEATVVDEVMETPMVGEAEPPGGWWIIRPNQDIEHMTVGTIDNSYVFEMGRRYRVPQEVMSILAHRDYLLEVPVPYKP